MNPNTVQAMNNNIANLSLLANLQAQAGSFLSLGNRAAAFGAATAHLRQPNPFFPAAAFLTSGFDNPLGLSTYALTGAQRNSLTVSKAESIRGLPEGVPGGQVLGVNKLNVAFQKQHKKGSVPFLFSIFSVYEGNVFY